MKLRPERERAQLGAASAFTDFRFKQMNLADIGKPPSDGRDIRKTLVSPTPDRRAEAA